MNSSLYEKMNILKDQKDLKDIMYCGKLELTETDKTTNQKLKIIKDVYIPIEKNNDVGEIFFKILDENGDVMAVQSKSGFLPSAKYLDLFNSPENANSLSILKEYASREGLTLNSMEKELDKISKELNLSKKEILAISKTSYDDEIHKDNNKEEKEDELNEEKIHLKEDDEKNNEHKKEEKEENENALNKINTKQKASLSQKIDGVNTLGSILNVPSNGELYVVYSDDIYGNTNNTRFSFLIKDSDGNFTQPENLKQISGNHSSLNIAESNRDGSNITQKQVYSSYMIKGTNNIEYVLTANIGTHGTIDLGLGQIDKTQGTNSKDSTAITVPIETTNTFYQTQREVKDDLVNPREGTYQATERVNELEEHKQAGCDKNLTSKELDGDKSTGHLHENDSTKNINENETSLDILAKEIYNSDDEIGTAFSHNDIKNMLKNAANNHPDYTIKELKNLVEKDCESYVDSINRTRYPQ